MERQEKTQPSEKKERPAAEAHSDKNSAKDEMGNRATGAKKKDQGNPSTTAEKQDTSRRGSTAKKDSDSSSSTQHKDSGSGEKKDSTPKK